MNEENLTPLEKVSYWMKNSIGLKAVSIGILILILMIPVGLIHSLIREREHLKENVIREVSNKWGHEQTVSGLILTLPYYTVKYQKQKNGIDKAIRTKHLAHFLPETLNITGKLNPEERHRGIYDVVLYNSNLNLNGTFNHPNFKKLGIKEEQVLWNQATLTLGLTDLRSIQNELKLKWNNTTFSFDPGIKSKDLVKSGLNISLNLDAKKQKHTFSLTLNINGSNGLNFTPLGKVTEINLSSNWKDPSFDGSFLPDTKSINQHGFEANWKVLHMNRNYPQQFIGKQTEIANSNFGVSLFTPVDQYQKSMRSVKYAILFIALTFLVYFFVQIRNKIHIHPIQYLIVGFGLCLFFALLIAFTEHISFALSYLIASAAIVFLVTIYSHFIFKKLKLTMAMAFILSLLYAFIYVILQLQEYSLLMGTIGLFIILAAVMFISRNIDWYNLKSKQ